MSDRNFMREALEEARAALDHDDVPIGAVAVRDGQVIARAHNERELRSDPTAHAEIIALQRAAEGADDWRLSDVSLFVTVEPCPMCAGALVAARIKRLVYGAPDERAGAAYSIYNIVQDPRLNHQCEISAGVMADECAEILQEFFRGRRGKIDYL